MDQIKDMTLNEIVDKANEEASGKPKEVSTSGGLVCESSEGKEKFMGEKVFLIAINSILV